MNDAATGPSRPSALPDPLGAFRLDGRTVVITGASSGLGVRFARVTAAVGARLVLAARRRDMLDAVADELRAAGAPVLAVTADVTSPDDCRAVADAAMAEFGSVDVLINNAGLGGAGSALRLDPADFARAIDINLNGAFYMAQACALAMRPGSSIVNIGSALGGVASRFPSASYSASKAGIEGLTRDLSAQWSGRKGIRVNALAPGFFESEMTAVGQEALEQMVAESSPLGRFGEPHELDGALLYLASGASSYTTGSTLVVDGGLTTAL